MALLELHDVAKAYGRHEVFRGLNLTLVGAEAVGIIGPNGAGKTTLLRILVGLIRPSQGTVLLDGGRPSRALARVPVGYFAGEATLPPRPKARRWARLFDGGSDVVTEDRQIRVLSRGTRQTVGLKAVLAPPEPRLIVLDEPWEGLDPDASRWLSQVIRAKREAGVGVILSSHRLYDLAGLCDRYAFLSGGSMVCLRGAELDPSGSVTGASLFAAFDRLRGANG